MATAARFPFIFTPGVPSTQPFIFTTGPVNQPFIFTTGPVNQPFIFQTDNSRAGAQILGQNANFFNFRNDIFSASRNLNFGWASYGGWNANYYGGFGW